MQRFIGRVVATTLLKTCTVLVETQHAARKNPSKIIYKHKKYLVHDEKNLTIPGDVVSIEYYKKLSSRKSFIVAEILKSARTWIDPSTGQVMGGGDLDALAESIKEAERNIEPQLSFDDPFIARLDGVSFKRYTSSLEKPFDMRFTRVMQATAEALYKKFQPSAVFVQSDEVSLLFHPNVAKNGNLQLSSHLYNGRAFKLVSILASAASLYFFQNACAQGLKRDAYFDGRVLCHQRPDLVFKWRAHDLRRNAINSIGQALYGHRRIENMPLSELERDLVQKFGPLQLKYGVSNIFGTLFKKKEIMKEGFDPISKLTVLAKRSIVEGRSIDLLKEDLHSLLNCHLWEKDEKQDINGNLA